MPGSTGRSELKPSFFTWGPMTRAGLNYALGTCSFFNCTVTFAVWMCSTHVFLFVVFFPVM